MNSLPGQFAWSPRRHVAAKVLATVPASLHNEGGTSEWARLQRGVEWVPSFIEGPVVLPDGDVLVVDLAWGRILRFGRGRSDVRVVARYDGEPNGLALDEDRGRLLIADFRHGIMVLDDLDGSGTVVPILQRYGFDSFRGVNDLTLDQKGNLYFTDQGGSGLQDPSGRVFRMSPSGDVEPVVSGVPSPNGIAYDESNGHLYVAVTRDNAIWRVAPAGSGRAARVGRWIQLSGGIGPDGLALGHDGTLYIAHLGMGLVWVCDERGVVWSAIESPAGLATTNVTVDEVRRRVIVTESESGSLLTTDLDELAAVSGI